jgi:hypothetical protein
MRHQEQGKKMKIVEEKKRRFEATIISEARYVVEVSVSSAKEAEQLCDDLFDNNKLPEPADAPCVVSVSLKPLDRE